ncbi:MAG: galactokinase [Candidatus Limnocylindrales bacterium]
MAGKNTSVPEVAFEPAALRAALATFAPAAAADPEAVRIVRAPGRVNLIGEYTDINEGLVLPVAIDLEIRLAFVPLDEPRLELQLLASGEQAALDLTHTGAASGTWLDRLAATALELQRAGLPVRGLRGVLAATLPEGAGLSSSHALEVAAAWALSGPGGPPLGLLELARLVQRVENEHVGVQTGLMDQVAIIGGQAGAALLFDCRSLALQAVSLPLQTHQLVVIDSGVRRRLDGSAYNERRAECERAVATIASRHPEVRSLRDVDLALLERERDRLDAVAYRRARHVVLENERVRQTVRALERGDIAAVGALWAASHASLRDDFEVSSPALDALVEIAWATPGVAAARMTGAGFGGCTVNLIERGATETLREAVAKAYRVRVGVEATVIPVEPAAGAGQLLEP